MGGQVDGRQQMGDLSNDVPGYSILKLIDPSAPLFSYLALARE
jgi:hypothetical protein